RVIERSRQIERDEPIDDVRIDERTVAGQPDDVTRLVLERSLIEPIQHVVQAPAKASDAGGGAELGYGIVARIRAGRNHERLERSRALHALELTKEHRLAENRLQNF